MDADFQAGEVGGLFDAAVDGVKIAGAGVVVAKAAEKTFLGGEQDLLADGTFERGPAVGIIAEQVRQAEHAELRGKPLKARGRNFGHAETAELEELDALAFGAELGAGVKIDAHGAAAFGSETFAEVGHREMDRVGLVETVRELDDGDGTLTGAAGETEGKGDGEQGKQAGETHGDSAKKTN